MHAQDSAAYASATSSTAAAAGEKGGAGAGAPEAADCLLCSYPITVYTVTNCKHSHEVCATCMLRLKLFAPEKKDREDARTAQAVAAAAAAAATAALDASSASAGEGTDGSPAESKTPGAAPAPAPAPAPAAAGAAAASASASPSSSTSSSSTSSSSTGGGIPPPQPLLQLAGSRAGRTCQCPFCHSNLTELLFTTDPNLKYEQVDFKSAAYVNSQRILTSPFDNAPSDSSAAAAAGKLDLVFDQRLKVYADSRVLLAHIIKLCSLYCTVCDANAARAADREASRGSGAGAGAGAGAGQSCERPPVLPVKTFPSLDHLRRHLEKEHHVDYCQACLTTRQAFLPQLRPMNKAQIALHFERGDEAVGDEGASPPHPYCRFCVRRPTPPSNCAGSCMLLFLVSSTIIPDSPIPPPS